MLTRMMRPLRIIQHCTSRLGALRSRDSCPPSWCSSISVTQKGSVQRSWHETGCGNARTSAKPGTRSRRSSGTPSRGASTGETRGGDRGRTGDLMMQSDSSAQKASEQPTGRHAQLYKHIPSPMHIAAHSRPNVVYPIVAHQLGDGASRRECLRRARARLNWLSHHSKKRSFISSKIADCGSTLGTSCHLQTSSRNSQIRRACCRCRCG